MRQGLKKVGAPEDMILWIEEPSVALSQELMSKVDLALATGGAAMVKSAYSSGTPAYGVGAGNPVIIVAEDADIEDAAQKIFVSKTFDNATSCSSDNSIVIQNAVFDKMVAAFEKRGGYMCNDEEKQKLHDWVWIPSKKTGKLALNPAIIAVSVEKIAKGAGLDVPADTTMLMVTEDKPGENKWSGEKLSPVMTLWRYDEFAQAMDMLTKIHAYAGVGHSCCIHTFKKEYIEQLGENIKVSRIMVRQAHAPSCGGNFHNGMPSTVTLGCGTWGGNITNDNISFKHFINLTWVSEPFAPVKPTEEDIWAELWAKCGK
jgi:sulfoacetaldehyde dehydrogenase